jgi:hypothetical protein
MLEEEVPRTATPLVRDLEANQLANSLRPIDDGLEALAGEPHALPALGAAAAAAALLVGARRGRKPRRYIFVWQCVSDCPKPQPSSLRLTNTRTVYLRTLRYQCPYHLLC